MISATKKIRTVAFDARYVNDQYHGIGRAAFHLLEALTRLDSQRHYVAFYHPDYQNTRYALQDLAQRPNVMLRPTRLRLYSPGEQLGWPRLLARAQADLFHTPYVLLPFLARVPMVMTVYDLIMEQHPEYRPKGLLPHFYTPVTRAGIARATTIFACSEATSHEIQSFYHVPAKRILVIGNAVDPTFRPVRDVEQLAQVRARYHLPSRFILTLGANRPHKNVETLVDAFARLDPDRTPPLVIGGMPDPRFSDRVGARIQTLGLSERVVRLGKVREEDLNAIYTLADVFAMPSLLEGFGLGPVEAMACGTPVVASSTPAVAETVGDAAILFDPRNPAALAAALAQVLNDVELQSSLRQRGFMRARTLNWDRVARTTLHGYAALEASRGATAAAGVADHVPLDRSGRR